MTTISARSPDPGIMDKGTGNRRVDRRVPSRARFDRTFTRSRRVTDTRLVAPTGSAS